VVPKPESPFIESQENQTAIGMLSLAWTMKNLLT